MRSQHADRFNHDEEAADYDHDVTNEKNPIRAGYKSVIDWIGRRVAPHTRVLDLGSGTGNTIGALPASCPATAVDVSVKMTAIAEVKLRGRDVTFVQQDVLEYVATADLSAFGAIISTYTLHHLTAEERTEFFRLLADWAAEDVQILIGDLMVNGETDWKRIVDKNREEFPDLEVDLNGEFLWDVPETEGALAALGWTAEWKRFSDLSWVLECRRDVSRGGSRGGAGPGG